MLLHSCTGIHLAHSPLYSKKDVRSGAGRSGISEFLAIEKPETERYKPRFSTNIDWMEISYAAYQGSSS